MQSLVNDASACARICKRRACACRLGREHVWTATQQRKSNFVKVLLHCAILPVVLEHPQGVKCELVLTPWSPKRAKGHLNSQTIITGWQQTAGVGVRQLELLLSLWMFEDGCKKRRRELFSAVNNNWRERWWNEIKGEFLINLSIQSQSQEEGERCIVAEG